MVTKKVAMNPQRQTASVKYFKTIEEMSMVSGIGEKTLRILVENGEIDYIAIGNRRLITDSAIWDWYDRNKVAAILAEREDELCQSIAAR